MKYFFTAFITAIVMFIAVHHKYERVIAENYQLEQDKRELLNLRIRLLNDIKQANEIFNSAYYLKPQTNGR